MPGNRRWVTAVLRGREAVTVLTAEHKASGLVVRGLAHRAARAGDEDAERAAMRGALLDARKQARGAGITVTALNARTAVMREAQFPLFTPDELVAALQSEARRHIPLDLRESAFDYQVLARDEQAQVTHVLLVAVPRRNLVDTVEPMSRVGAEPWIIDVEPLAAVNALLHFEPLESEQALGLIEITQNGLTFTLLSADGHFLTRTVGAYDNEPGAELVAATADPFQQRDADRRFNDPLAAGESSVTDADRLTLDVRRTLSFFQQTLGRKPRMRLRVVGPNPLRSEVIARLQSALQIDDISTAPVDRIPFAKNVRAPEALVTGESADLLVAFGLALRHISPKGTQRPWLAINVYPDRGRRQKRERSRMVGVAAASFVLALNAGALGFLLLATQNLARNVRSSAAEVEHIKAEAVRVQSTAGHALAERETLDKRRTTRMVWSPALVATASRLPWSLELTSVALASASAEDTLGTAITIRGIVVQSTNADPFGPVTEYVENLRESPTMQRLFPYVDIINTWEATTTGSTTRNFEIRCSRREQVR